MQIGIDGRCIQDKYPGVGRYVYQVAQELAKQNYDHHLVIFYNPSCTNTRFDLDTLDAQSNVTLIETSLQPFQLQEQLAWPLLLREHRIELFHAPHFVAPLLASCPVVLTIHDLILDRYPSYVPQRRLRFYKRMLIRQSLCKAAHIIVVSEATRRDLCHFYSVDPRKISVTPEAAAPAFRPVPEDQTRVVRERYDLPQRFVLAVGDRRPHKNLMTLLKAFAQIAPHTDADLVLAGRTDTNWPDEVTRLLYQLGLNARVVQPGYIAESDLPALYTLSDVVACPSLVEGFGLSLLEAMACGAAVVASHASSLPEVVGDAGVLVCPRDAQTLSQAILSILQNSTYRQELQRQSLVRAASFSWRSTANLTRQVYRAAINNRRSVIDISQSVVAYPSAEC